MSDLIEYSVHFEDYASNLFAHFRNLLHFQILVDTTLMCNSNTLRVHKIVLVSGSSYFQESLQHKAGELLITLKMNFDVLKSIVEFMYSGKTSFLSIHKQEFLSAARFLKITGLAGLEFNYTDPLPEFQIPVVFNKPSQFTQESQQNDNEQTSDNILEANLLKQAARKLQKIEKNSIKAIQQLQKLQKIPCERLEVSDDIMNQDMQGLIGIM